METSGRAAWPQDAGEKPPAFFIRILFFVSLAVLAAWLFVPGLTRALLNDDYCMILRLRGLPASEWSSVLSPAFYNNFWRPMVPLVYWALDRASGMNPLPYRLLSLGLHLLTTLVLWRILTGLARPRGNLEALTLALLAVFFFVHFRIQEVLFHFISFKEIIGAACGLGSIFSMVLWKRTRQARWYWVAFGSVALSITGLESSVIYFMVLPGLIIFIDPPAEGWARRVRPALPFILGAVVYLSLFLYFSRRGERDYFDTQKHRTLAVMVADITLYYFRALAPYYFSPSGYLRVQQALSAVWPLAVAGWLAAGVLFLRIRDQYLRFFLATSVLVSLPYNVMLRPIVQWDRVFYEFVAWLFVAAGLVIHRSWEDGAHPAARAVRWAAPLALALLIVRSATMIDAARPDWDKLDHWHRRLTQDFSAYYRAHPGPKSRQVILFGAPYLAGRAIGGPHCLKEAVNLLADRPVCDDLVIPAYLEYQDGQQGYLVLPEANTITLNQDSDIFFFNGDRLSPLTPERARELLQSWSK